MKTKILLTSTLALAISVPAMAADPTPTTVTSTSSCTETTLGTATGPVDIEADWQANTINLTWDANEGTVSGGPKQCTYDGTFTLPTSITRTGYNFTGWKVVQAACFISDSDVTNDGPAFGSIALSGKSNDDQYRGGATAATYGLTQPGEWGVTLASGGKVTGKAVCATSAPADISYLNDVLNEEKDFDITEATAAMGAEKAGILQQVFSLLETGEETDEEAARDLVFGKLYMTDSAPTGTGGYYCYCGASSYTSSTGETCTAASRWALLDTFGGSVDDCASDCATHCSHIAQRSSSFRAVLFGSGN